MLSFERYCITLFIGLAVLLPAIFFLLFARALAHFNFYIISFFIFFCQTISFITSQHPELISLFNFFLLFVVVVVAAVSNWNARSLSNKYFFYLNSKRTKNCDRAQEGLFKKLRSLTRSTVECKWKNKSRKLCFFLRVCLSLSLALALVPQLLSVCLDAYA